MLDAAYAAIADGGADGEIPSGVLAVSNADELLRLEAFGSVATDSIFLLASITKPIFATSMMRLVERGRVLLDEPIAGLIPDFAASGKGDVRLWHLLTHTSGLDEGWVARMLSGDERGDWERVLEQSCAAPLLFRPGSRYLYTNASFVVMAEVMRRLTGQDHASYLHESILAPLRMHDTSYSPPDSPRVVTVLDPPWRNEQERAGWIGLRHPAAGLWSTAADLVRFGQALLRDGELADYRVVAPATLRAMTTLQTGGITSVTAGGEFQAYYGLGFSKVGPNAESGPSGELRSPGGFGHGGATGTYLWIEPEFDRVFVFLTNRWGNGDRTLKRALNATIAAASI